MHMKNGRNDENEIYQNFDFHFHIGENTVFCVQSAFQCMGKIPLCTYVHRASTFSIVRYDVFAYGTAYIISSTKSNDTGGGFFGAFPGGSPRLSYSANEQTLLKIDYEDRLMDCGD